MRIIATCMASNEADVIEAFARHNLRYLDALVILDHASVDRTHAIVEALVREGLPIVLLHDPERAFHQGARQTQLARRYLTELDADFCFALDADELIKAPSRPALEATLSAVPAGSHAVLFWQHYFGSAGAPANADPVRRLTQRLREERVRKQKVILARAFADDAAAQVSLGNHAALRVVDGRAVPARHALLPDLHLAHFPVRSPSQIARKALVGWLAHRLTYPERFSGPQGPGHAVPASHWRDLFLGLSEGRLAVDASLVEVATAIYAGSAPGREGPVRPEELVDDPLPCDYTLRYTELESASPLATLAAWSDRLVSDVNATTGGAWSPGSPRARGATTPGPPRSQR